LAVLVGGSRFPHSSIVSELSGGVLLLEVPLCELAVRWGSPGGGGFRGTCTGNVETPGGIEATSLGACDSASAGAEPEEALHTFTLDSGASRCFFCDSTTVTPLTTPVPVTLADPSGGPVVARGATVLPCPAAPFGLLTGLHLPSFAKNFVATSVLQDQWVTVTQPRGELVAICTDSRIGEHLATFTRRPGSGLYTLTTESAVVAESGQVAASVEVSASCLCRLLTHQTLLWHHSLGQPSLPRLRGMHSRLLVSGLPRSLPPLPRSLALPCLPCVEGRQRAAPHPSLFPPTTAPLQTLHMDVWGPARVTGQDGEGYFLLVVDDYTRYTTVFPLQSKADVRFLIRWIRAVRLQLRARFREDLPVLRLHSVRGGEFCSRLLEDFCGAKGIVQSYMLSASPQQNGIAERRIGLVMELNLCPRVSHPETFPTLRWTGEVGDASAFRVWGSLSLVHDLPTGKLSPRTLRCVFLGFPTVAPPWQFYHPGSRRVLSSRDVTFDEFVCFYCLHPHCSSPVPLLPLSLSIAMDSGAAGGGDTRGADSGGAGSGGAASPTGAGGAGGAVAGGSVGGGAGGGGVGGAGAGGACARRQETLSPERLHEWAVRWGSPGGGGGLARAAGSGGTGRGGASAGIPGVGRAGGTGAGGIGTTGGTGGVAAVGASAGSPGTRRHESLSPERLREWVVRWGGPGGGAGCARAAGSGGVFPGGASDGVPGVGRAGGTGTGGTGATGGTGGVGPVGACAVVPGVGGTGGADTRGATGGTGVGGARRQESLLPQQLREWAVRWGSPGGGPGGAGSRGVVPTGARVFGGVTTQPQLSAPRHLLSLLPAATEFPVAGTTPPLLFLLTVQSQPQLLPGSPLSAPAPHTAVTESFIERREYASRPVMRVRSRRAVRPRPPPVPGTHIMALLRLSLRLLATVVTGPSFESAGASALVDELVDFAALCRLDYAASLVFYSCPPSVGGELSLGTDVLEDRQFELECLAAAAPHLASTPGFLVSRVKRPGSPLAFKARYVARGFSQREGVDFFQTFSPTLKMTTLRVQLHVAAQHDYELHSLDFSTTFLQGSLHEAIYLRRPVYDLQQAPREWHDTPRTTLAALGFAPSTANPSLFLRTDSSLSPFYVLVYIDDLVFATADTEALALVKAEVKERDTCNDLGELRRYLGLQITQDRARRTITLTQSHMVQQILQRFDFSWSSPQPTPLSTVHSLSAPPSDESVEPSGPYPELVGCLMYLMTCTRPDLAYALSLLAHYVYIGMGLVLVGLGSVVLTGHSDASWADDQTTHCCEAEIHAGAMAVQELRWLTYLLTDLGEWPRSPPILYVDNKAMIALCQDQRLEHRMKHIALRSFLTRELQQHGQLRLAYVATQANTTDVFSKALGSSDHQCFCIALGLVPTLPHLLVS
ncbi:unnamed protein product, partial [Closterium sp. NIES-53]